MSLYGRSTAGLRGERSKDAQYSICDGSSSLKRTRSYTIFACSPRCSLLFRAPTSILGAVWAAIVDAFRGVVVGFRYSTTTSTV